MGREYQGREFCTHCSKFTDHLIYDDQHERDSSHDWCKCLNCNYMCRGMSGEYEAPICATCGGSGWLQFSDCECVSHPCKHKECPDCQVMEEVIVPVKDMRTKLLNCLYDIEHAPAYCSPSWGRNRTHVIWATLKHQHYLKGENFIQFLRTESGAELEKKKLFPTEKDDNYFFSSFIKEMWDEGRFAVADYLERFLNQDEKGLKQDEKETMPSPSKTPQPIPNYAYYFWYHACYGAGAETYLGGGNNQFLFAVLPADIEKFPELRDKKEVTITCDEDGKIILVDNISVS